MIVLGGGPWSVHCTEDRGLQLHCVSWKPGGPGRVGWGAGTGRAWGWALGRYSPGPSLAGKGGGRFGRNSPLLYLDVPAVMLGGPVAVPSEVLLPVGFPETIVPPVVFHI